MKLEEAIENNNENLEINKPGMYPDYAEAIQLGIEALERLKELRSYEPQTLSKTWEKIFGKLPSETE